MYDAPMAARRGAGSTPDVEPTTWRHLLAIAVPIGSVLGVLVLGLALRVDPAERPLLTYDERAGLAHEAAAGPDLDLPPAEPATPRAPALDERLEALARRATADLDRVSSAADGFTAQLALLCDKDGVARLVERFDDQERLYVLPADHEGRACLLICWGLYADADAARAAADMPAALREVHPQPFPKRVADVLQALR